MTGKLLSAAKELQPHDWVSGTHPLNLCPLQLQWPVICTNSKSQQSELSLLIEAGIQPNISKSNYRIKLNINNALRE